MKTRTFVGCLLGIVLIGVGAGTVVFMKSGAELDDVVTVLKQQVQTYDYSWQSECDDRCAEYIGSTAMAELDGAGCQQLTGQLELAKMFGEVDAVSMKAIRDKMNSLPDCDVKVRSYKWQELCDESCARQIGEEKMQWLNLATCVYLEIEVDSLRKRGVLRTEPIAKAIYDKAQFAKCKTRQLLKTSTKG